MPLITPVAAPPLRNHPDHTGERTNITPNAQPIAPQGTRTEHIGENSARRIPKVCVDVDTVPDIMAAKLATSLLGHVMFLKNQIPFPMLQLSRLPGGKASAKLQRDLIDSFDTLSSHLDTTFTMLSTAFARSTLTNQLASGTADAPRKLAASPAYMAILIGPSIGTAKSKVILAVDSLEAKIWGLRDEPSPETVDDDEEDEGSSEASEEEELDEEDESFANADNDDEDSNSPPEDSDSEDDSDTSSVSSDSNLAIPPSSPLPPPLPHKAALPTSTASASYLQDHAHEQQKIRAANQLLSRTLAIADAEGRGMACELAPSQTHVLLRAPRRFSHPAWVPRPNYTNSMEHTLNDFLEETRLYVDTSSEDRNQKRAQKQKQKQKVEGVWVAGRSQSLDYTQEPSCSDGEQQENVDEGDEMIWWSWDGKLVGFTGW
ncbi:hypothetical protein EV360DRAFT_44583 [Lentinula raphanica]|nr:hypothetical protein EV360DRAFT_44583 [Lentinula raphanica]